MTRSYRRVVVVTLKRKKFTGFSYSISSFRRCTLPSFLYGVIIFTINHPLLVLLLLVTNSRLSPRREVNGPQPESSSSFSTSSFLVVDIVVPRPYSSSLLCLWLKSSSLKWNRRNRRRRRKSWISPTAHPLQNFCSLGELERMGRVRNRKGASRKR